MVATDPVGNPVTEDLETDLIKAGLEETQARVLRQVIDRAVDRMVSRFATRSELHAARDELRTELHATRDELRTELHVVRDELRTEFRESLGATERQISVQLKIMWAVMMLIGGGLFALMAAILAKL